MLAKELGLAERTSRNWVAHDAIDAGRDHPGALTSDERQGSLQLRREVKALQMERKILRNATASFTKETLGTGFGSSTRSGPRIRSHCSVACSGWSARAITPGSAGRRRRGPRKMPRSPPGSATSTRPVGQRMASPASTPTSSTTARRTGCQRGRRRVRTTTADPGARPAPNVLDRDITASGPVQRWVGDLIYLPTDEG